MSSVRHTHFYCKVCKSEEECVEIKGDVPVCGKHNRSKFLRLKYGLSEPPTPLELLRRPR